MAPRQRQARGTLPIGISSKSYHATALIGGTNPEANNEADRQEYQAYDFHCSYRSKLRDRSKEKGPGDGDGLALRTAQEGGTPSKGITRLLTETPARSFPKNEI